MTTKAYDAIAASKAAAEAEGIFEPTEDQRQAIARLAQLQARIDRDEAESDAIKNTLVAQMDAIGARALAVNGKNLVRITPKTKGEFYPDALAGEYPEIAAAFFEAKAAYDAHVDEFTFRVQATPAKEFPGAR